MGAPKGMPSREEFHRQAQELNNSTAALARHYGVTFGSVNYYRRKYNLPTDRIQKKEKGVSKSDLEILVTRFRTDQEIALHLGVKTHLVRHYRQLYGIAPGKKHNPKPAVQYVTVAEYCALAGIDKTSVRDRLKSGTLTLAKLPGVSPSVRLIDIVRYPPARKRQPNEKAA